MKITFYGGAMSVTGANYLVNAGGANFLVDCGLYQGFKYAEELNYAKFVYDPKKIDFVLLTHSHTDHIGRLPKLVKEGFRGTIYSTEPTKNLTVRALPDNWRLMKEEALKDNHAPLYGEKDIENTFSLMKTVSYREKIRINDRVEIEFLNAGHILGSAIVKIQWREKTRDSKIKVRKFYFTGDLGNSPSLLLPDKEFVDDADYVVIESAYGNRIHEDSVERSRIFKDVIKYVCARKGTLMIPSFAIERTQEILFEINKLLRSGEIPDVPVFMDSPLATKMTEVYSRHKDYLNEEAKEFFKINKRIFDFPGLKHTLTTEQSKKINDVSPPKIIIAGSGMSNGGRILHHERRYLSDPNSAIVFVGYQVENSLGRRILDGASEVKIFGENVPVRCFVKGIGGYSAHADQPALLDWTEKANKAKNLKKVFITQGEETSSKALAEIMRNKMNLDAIVPSLGEEFDL